MKLPKRFLERFNQVFWILIIDSGNAEKKDQIKPESVTRLRQNMHFPTKTVTLTTKLSFLQQKTLEILFSML